MDISQALVDLNITSYPDDFIDFCNKYTPVSICDKNLIEKLDSEYDFLGKYKAPLLECLEIVKSNEALVTYGGYAAKYLTECTIDDTRKVVVPIHQEDTVLRFYPLLVLCATLPYGIEKYKTRGFTKEEIYDSIHTSFIQRIDKAYTDNGKQGLDYGAYSWLRLYTVAGVFKAGIFNVTPRENFDKILAIKNKLSGQIIPLAEGEFHKSGYPLGSEGYTDEEGSFELSFEEREDSFIGCPVIDSKVTKERRIYPKAEWEKLLVFGDGVAAIHIPVGAALEEEKILEGFRLALKISRERYPEYKVKAVTCSSWMLDPTLKEVLGEKSKISNFIDKFTKYPLKSSGQTIFGFVFPSAACGYENLPEETSLQRKLKKMYIEGNYIYSYSGIADGIF